MKNKFKSVKNIDLYNYTDDIDMVTIEYFKSLFAKGTKIPKDRFEKLDEEKEDNSQFENGFEE